MDGTRDSSQVFSIILGGLASLASILAAVSPIISPNNPISVLFLDTQAPSFASIIAIVAVLVSFSIFYSPAGFMIFGSSLINLFKFRLFCSVAFVISFICFYFTNIFSKVNVISNYLAFILQISFYVAGFIFLAIAIAITVQSYVSEYKRQKAFDSHQDLIFSALIKNGILTSGVQILNVTQYLPTQSMSKDLVNQDQNNNTNPDFVWSYLVDVIVKDKRYLAYFYGDFSRIIRIVEIPKENEQQKN